MIELLSSDSFLSDFLFIFCFWLLEGLLLFLCSSLQLLGIVMNDFSTLHWQYYMLMSAAWISFISTIRIVLAFDLFESWNSKLIDSIVSIEIGRYEISQRVVFRLAWFYRSGNHLSVDVMKQYWQTGTLSQIRSYEGSTNFYGAWISWRKDRRSNSQMILCPEGLLSVYIVWLL